VRGFEAHSSLTPHGVNAVQIACEIVAYIAQRARAFRDEGTRDEAYDVPYTTTHVGTIRGGTALNIVPRDCTFDFEIRHLPFDDPDLFIRDVERSPRGSFPTCTRSTPAPTSRSITCRRLPGFDTTTAATSPRSASLQRDAGVARCRSAPRPRCSRRGIPTVICGPGHIAQAHQPNEWVSLDQIARCEAFMQRLVDRLHAR
jgi:acetylornithine deacetylase